MFSFVVWKILFQISRIIPGHIQISIISSKQTVLIFIVFYIRNFLSVVFIPNIVYSIITVWNFRSINNFSIFIPYMIIFYFWKYVNVSPNQYFIESAQSLTFNTDFLCSRFSTINFLGIYFVYFSGHMCLPTWTSTFFLLLAYK